MRDRRYEVSLLILLISAVGIAAQPRSDHRAQAEPKTESNSSLAGCVDESDGHYLLTDARELKPIADLEAEGFPTVAFAKYLGHRVTVRGTSSPGSTRPLFRVRRIENLSDTCGPEQR